jgi:hypothetical protein
MMKTPLTIREIIEHGLRSIASALNLKPPSPAMIDVWEALFCREDPRLLAKCFHYLVGNSDRMPTPRRMLTLLAALKPSSNPALTHVEGTDSQGTPCWYWGDEPRVPAYRAVDCEGVLECLAKVRELSQAKKGVAASDERARRVELQKQKIQILKEEMQRVPVEPATTHPVGDSTAAPAVSNGVRKESTAELGTVCEEEQIPAMESGCDKAKGSKSS